MIINQILPPKKGYIEIINDCGEHIYQPLPRQAKIDELKNDLQNIDVVCISENEAINTEDIINNKLDYLVNILNTILELI